MNELHELIEAFRSESGEILDRVEELLLRLEQTPDDDELLHEIFRGAHTIKGGAACLQFEELTALAHEVEEELEVLRSGAARATRATISRLLEPQQQLLDAVEDFPAFGTKGFDHFVHLVHLRFPSRRPGRCRCGRGASGRGVRRFG